MTNENPRAVAAALTGIPQLDPPLVVEQCLLDLLKTPEAKALGLVLLTPKVREVWEVAGLTPICLGCEEEIPLARVYQPVQGYGQVRCEGCLLEEQERHVDVAQANLDHEVHLAQVLSRFLE